MYSIHMPIIFTECIRYGTTQCPARAAACNLGQICVSFCFGGLKCDDTINEAVFSNV